MFEELEPRLKFPMPKALCDDEEFPPEAELPEDEGSAEAVVAPEEETGELEDKEKESVLKEEPVMPKPVEAEETALCEAEEADTLNFSSFPSETFRNVNLLNLDSFSGCFAPDGESPGEDVSEVAAAAAASAESASFEDTILKARS